VESLSSTRLSFILENDSISSGRGQDDVDLTLLTTNLASAELSSLDPRNPLNDTSVKCQDMMRL
jgi:hypothetical protein